MEAAIGLEAAADIGQHLVPGAHRRDARQFQHRLRVGFHAVGVDAVMDDRDLAAQFRLEAVGLIARRRQCRIGLHHRLDQMRRARDGAEARILDRAADLGVEADIMAARAIHQLGIDQQPRLGPDFLQEQGLAPAGMAEDHVGAVAMAVAQRPRAACRLQATRREFGEGPARRRRYGDFGRGLVAHDAHRAVAAVLLVRQRQHIMAARRQCGGQMRELAGKVLVDEQDLHGGTVMRDFGRSLYNLGTWRTAAIGQGPPEGDP